MQPFCNVLNKITALLAVILLSASCSSDGTLEDENVVDNRPKMVFGTSFSSSKEVASTRAYLESVFTDFKVGVWKSFGAAEQQNVMDGYKVENTAPTDWDYVGKLSGQIQRYWDLSAFPYDFRAVAPYDANVSITTTGFTVDATSRPFKSQTYINDAYNPATIKDSYVVAHVTRTKEGTNYKDFDVIKNEEVNNSSMGDATRSVVMPFHHLATQLGFKLFINDPQPTAPDYKVYLKSITISVVNSGNNFITESKKYTATYSSTDNSTGLLKGTFSPDTKATGEYILLQHGEYTGVDFREHLNNTNAYDLCPNFIHQIPQGPMKIRVKLEMETDHVTGSTVDARNPFDFDVLLSLDKTNTAGDDFTWLPDMRYIYYLHIPNLHGHVIYLNTCEILPWGEVQSTDIPIEL